MRLSKNKKYQYLFFSILSLYTIFNGGNSNLSIQINFILIGFLFLYSLKDKNYNLHYLNFLKRNKLSIIFYLIFLLYLVFQILPLPIEFLKIFSPEKYRIISKLNIDSSYASISLAISNSFFQILNFITMLILAFIIKMLFYTERHKNRFYLFLSSLGFFSSIIAILFYLYGNPDLSIIKNTYYKNASTGFFINRTIFAVFLLFSLISSLELLRNFQIKVNKKTDNFFLKIYIRLFIVFITIGIVTSFSRIGNFLFLVTILSYLINEFYFKKIKNNSLKYIVILILLIDILIVGLYFGGSKIVDRFYFLSKEIDEIYSYDINLSRFDIAKFGFFQLKNYLFFGYGAGGFQNLFQLNFSETSSLYANHAHSDLVEFIGEFGLFGSGLLLLSILNFFIYKNSYSFINIIILFYLIILLFFDFSLHSPIIQFMFVTFFTLNQKKINQLN